MGHRPNKASWYALTWRVLDRLPGYDPGAAESFRRGGYRQISPLKNTTLTPSGGAGRRTIAPSGGAERLPTAPSPGAIKTLLTPSPAPSPGDHLDKPSIAVKGQGVYKRLAVTPVGLFTNILNLHPTKMNNDPANAKTLKSKPMAQLNSIASHKPRFKHGNKSATKLDGKVSVTEDDDDTVRVREHGEFPDECEVAPWQD